VIENLEINGNIIIDAQNVTLKNIKLTTDDFHGIQVMDSATGFTLMDSEINGNGQAHDGFYGFGTILRTNIYGTENGINSSGAGPMLIQDNYIHGMAGDASSHFDSIEINSGHNIQILHNTIVNEHGQTSAIMMDNWAGGLSNIEIDGNYIEGGGYSVYLDDSFGGGTVDDASISITNNEVGGGQWGDYALYGNTPVMSGNVGLGETVAATAGGTIVPQTGESTVTPVTSGTEANTVVTSEAGSGATSSNESTATPVTSTGTDANAVVTPEAGSGAVSGNESTATPVTSTGTEANTVVTSEAGSGATSSNESTATPVTSTGTDANAVVTPEAGSGAVSGNESTATPVTSTGTDANAVEASEAGSAADHVSGGDGAGKLWFGHTLEKSSGADHHSHFDMSDFDVSTGWTGVRDGAVAHAANALDGEDYAAYDAGYESHNWDHGHTSAASDWLS
jgi:hypothetical protein